MLVVCWWCAGGELLVSCCWCVLLLVCWWCTGGVLLLVCWWCAGGVLLVMVGVGGGVACCSIVFLYTQIRPPDLLYPSDAFL